MGSDHAICAKAIREMPWLRRGPLLLMATAFMAPPSAGMAQEASKAPVSLCAISGDRAAYEGKTVVIRATVRTIFEHGYEWLEDPACPNDFLDFRFFDASVPRKGEFEWNEYRSTMCGAVMTLTVTLEGVIEAPEDEDRPRLAVTKIVVMDRWKTQQEMRGGPLCQPN